MDALLESAPAAATATRPPACVVAIVQAAGRRIGIDGEHVVQAVVVPPALTAMPRRAGGIAGVMAHLGQLVPVVRLQHWLDGTDAADDGAPPAPPGDARVVVLREGAQVVGLLVDAVLGMARCQAGAIARLFHDERPEELFARAALLDPAAPPLALLEPARLAALARVWAAAADPDTASAATAHTHATGDGAPAAGGARLGIFRIGDRLVGLCARDIGELLRTPVLQAPPFRSATARGLGQWRGQRLPVVDIAAAVGARGDAQLPGWLCVVRRGERILGVLVHELVELHPHDAGAAAPGAGLVRAELSTPRGIVQVLDTDALMSHCPESVISERTGDGATGVATAAAAATSPHSYLVFDAGGAFAARTDGIQEVVPLPADLRPRLESGLAASLPWRGHAVPVRALFADGRWSVAEARQLIVVVAGAQRAAIPIDGVRALIAAGTASLARVRVGTGAVDVVSTAAGAAERASYEVVDLLARTTRP